MCLYIKKHSCIQTAKKDKVVYKVLMKSNELIFPVKSEMKFKGIIKSIKCEGKIYIDERYNDIYFCTNETNLDGARGDTTLNYKYSWLFDEQVTSIIINKREYINNGIFITPYRRFPIIIGETYDSILEKNPKYINKGIHSFKNIKDAKNDADLYNVIVKCIIPKDSKYYKGIFNNVVSYASNKLKYVEIIYEKTK